MSVRTRGVGIAVQEKRDREDDAREHVLVPSTPEIVRPVRIALQDGRLPPGLPRACRLWPRPYTPRHAGSGGGDGHRPCQPSRAPQPPSRVAAARSSHSGGRPCRANRSTPQTGGAAAASTFAPLTSVSTPRNIMYDCSLDHQDF